MERMTDSGFEADAEHAIAWTVGCGRPGSPSIAILVIDDRGHDDIVAAIAVTSAASPFDHPYRGDWGLRTAVGSPTVMRFALIWRPPDRHWLVVNPGPEMLALMEREHIVCLMSPEIAGDTRTIDYGTLSQRLPAALWVKVTPVHPPRA